MPERQQYIFENLFNERTAFKLKVIELLRIPDGAINVGAQLPEDFLVGSDEGNFILIPEASEIKIGAGDRKYLIIDHQHFCVKIMREVKKEMYAGFMK